MADCKNSAFVVSYEDSIFHFWLPSKLYCLGAHLIAIGQTDPYFLSVTFSQVHFTSLLSSKLSGQGWWLFAPCMTRLKANIVWFEPIFIVDYLVLMQPCYVQKQKEFKETCVLVSYILNQKPKLLFICHFSDVNTFFFENAGELRLIILRRKKGARALQHTPHTTPHN